MSRVSLPLETFFDDENGTYWFPLPRAKSEAGAIARCKATLRHEYGVCPYDIEADEYEASVVWGTVDDGYMTVVQLDTSDHRTDQLPQQFWQVFATPQPKEGEQP